jgi:hypothetical protein
VGQINSVVSTRLQIYMCVMQKCMKFEVLAAVSSRTTITTVQVVTPFSQVRVHHRIAKTYYVLYREES